ncbi:MAG: metallophosphoesterase [Planctomycetota bacterium]
MAEGASAVDSVCGRVFLDSNANGRLDEGEKPIAGVDVTDGINFVTTGRDGSYKIDIADDPVISFKPAGVVSLSWPSGKWPTGRWWRRLSDIKTDDAVNFGLREDEQKLPFIFVHITDDHGWGRIYPAFGKEMEKLGERVKLCLHTGDMGYASMENADAMFSSVAKNAKAFPVPTFFTPGNRDLVQPPDGDWNMQNPLAGHGAFTKHLGPIRWSFDYAGCHFFGVDWMRWPDGKLEEGTPRVGLEWLQKDLSRLEPGTKIFGFVHYFPSAGESFFALMRKHKVTHVFGGHNHRHGRYLIDGVAGTTTISLRGNGGCTLGIVCESGFDAVFRCAGCKGAAPTDHCSLCGLWQLKHKLLPSLLPRRGRRQTISETSLGPGTKEIRTGQAAAVEIAAEIQPATAEKVGLMIEGQEPVEIAYDGKSLEVAGVSIPFSLRPNEKALRWHLVVENGKMTFYANSLIRVDKAVDLKSVSKVTFFAEGGSALVKRADVWELKAQP